MSYLIKPANYKALLDLKQTELGIKQIKEFFQQNLSSELRLRRVTAPLFVLKGMGINDDLSGTERPVSFPIKDLGDAQAEVVHSLAKWKRLTLADYNIEPGYGIYTDMNAIRRDEDELDNLHSVYVDQWDWEKVILPENRNLDYLKSTVMDIVEAICDTQDTMQAIYPQLQSLGKLDRRVSFVTSQQLEDAHPELTPKQRENAYLKEHKTAFIIGIGGALKSGQKHDGRAPDYDDWDLNGDIMFWDDVLGCAMEVSSMGIRVDPTSLDRQLSIAGCDERRELPYHKMLLAGELPLTIGGGIGQSRLSMLLLGKAHIGEVQASIWDEYTEKVCSETGVTLL